MYCSSLLLPPALSPAGVSPAPLSIPLVSAITATQGPPLSPPPGHPVAALFFFFSCGVREGWGLKEEGERVGGPDYLTTTCAPLA